MEGRFEALAPVDAKTGHLVVVVDTPRGSPVKFKYDEKRGVFTVARFLPSGLAFPFDFGFVPGTKAEDGGALDVVLLMEAPSFPGCVVPARLLGVLEAKQRKKGRMVRDDRLIAVAADSPRYRKIRGLRDLGREAVDGIERFLEASNRTPGRRFQAIGRFGVTRARAILRRSLLSRPAPRPAGTPSSSGRRGVRS